MKEVLQISNRIKTNASWLKVIFVLFFGISSTIQQSTSTNLSTNNSLISTILQPSFSSVLVIRSTFIVGQKTINLTNVHTTFSPTILETIVINSYGGRVKSTIWNSGLMSIRTASSSGINSTTSFSIISVKSTTTPTQSKPVTSIKQNVVLLHKFKSSGVFKIQNTSSTSNENVTTDALQEKVNNCMIFIFLF